MTLHPIPTKTRTSFDIPKLLELIKEKGEFRTSAAFQDLLVVRNYIMRHALPYRLSQQAVYEEKTDAIIGYVLTLRPQHDAP